MVINDSASRLVHPLVFLRGFLRDLVSSRFAIRALLARNLALRYRYSSFGVLWAFAPPLVTAAAMVLGQRVELLGSGPKGVGLAFYAVFGVAMAQTFLESMNIMKGTFTSHRQLLARGNMPIEGIIASSLLEEIFHTTARLAVVLLGFVFGVKASASTFPLVFTGFLGLVFAGAGIGLLIAPIASFKSDIDKAMAVFPWIFFAVTPVFLHSDGGGLLHTIYKFNPAAWVFDGIRHAAYGGSGPLWAALLVLPAGFALFVAGCLWCRLARPYAMERSV